MTLTGCPWINIQGESEGLYGITRRRDRWVIDFYDQHGKRQRKTLKKGTSKKEAKGELRAIEEMVDKGVYMPTKKIPLFSEVAKDWIEYKRPNLRESTWEGYKGHTENQSHYNCHS